MQIALDSKIVTLNAVFRVPYWYYSVFTFWFFNSYPNTSHTLRFQGVLRPLDRIAAFWSLQPP